MTAIEYVPRKFAPASLRIIQQANAICAEYQAQGLDLTLRQVFYQFVSRGLIPNNQREYTKLGSTINNARLAGLLDWDYIVDRTRNLQSVPTWNSPGSLVNAAARQFAVDKWDDQPTRPEVWIEKDALVGVIQQPCRAEQTDYFSCRGYTSQSEIWGAAQRIGEYLRSGQNVTIIHLGDHDPSGIDMTRDIEDRMRIFLRKDNINAARDLHRDNIAAFWSDHPDVSTSAEARDKYPEDHKRLIDGIQETLDDFGAFQVNRIALNMDQVEQYSPPPNYAKITDSRFEGYQAQYGDDSWELDALEPTVLRDLILDAIAEDRNEDLWEAAVEREEAHRERLTMVANRWTEVVEYLDGETA